MNGQKGAEAPQFRDATIKVNTKEVVLVKKKNL